MINFRRQILLYICLLFIVLLWNSDKEILPNFFEPSKPFIRLFLFIVFLFTLFQFNSILKNIERWIDSAKDNVMHIGDSSISYNFEIRKKYFENKASNKDFLLLWSQDTKNESLESDYFKIYIDRLQLISENEEKVLLELVKTFSLENHLSKRKSIFNNSKDLSVYLNFILKLYTK